MLSMNRSASVAPEVNLRNPRVESQSRRRQKSKIGVSEILLRTDILHIFKKENI